MKKLLLPLILVIILTQSIITSANLRVVTSINVLTDWIRIVGGDKVEVHTLITGLETPHTYSPKPSDTLAINKADTFIGVGLGLESWLEPLLKNSSKKNLTVFYLSKGIIALHEDDHDAHGHDHDVNPHIWLSLENAEIMVNNIADYLASLDSINAVFYKENAINYAQRLRDLKNKYYNRFLDLKDKRLISFPASYPYLFAEMGIDEVARGEEVHGQEPSAKKMVSLANLMKQNNIKVLVTEKLFSSPLPATLAKETSAKLVHLSPLLVDKQSYLELMETNYINLLEAMPK